MTQVARSDFRRNLDIKLQRKCQFLKGVVCIDDLRVSEFAKVLLNTEKVRMYPESRVPLFKLVLACSVLLAASSAGVYNISKNTEIPAKYAAWAKARNFIPSRPTVNVCVCVHSLVAEFRWQVQLEATRRWTMGFIMFHH